MEEDEVHARLRRAAEQLVAEAMSYQPPTSFGADYIRIRAVAEGLFREGLVPGSEESMPSASAFGIGVLVGLTAAGSS
jgi:hypothetical protein